MLTTVGLEPTRIMTCEALSCQLKETSGDEENVGVVKEVDHYITEAQSLRTIVHGLAEAAKVG
jgi:hypothetical protein